MQIMRKFTTTESHLTCHQAIESIYKKDTKRFCARDLDNLRDIFSSELLDDSSIQALPYQSLLIMRLYNIPLPIRVTLFHGPTLMSKLGIMTCCVFERWIYKIRDKYLYAMQHAHMFTMKRLTHNLQFRGSSLKTFLSFLFGTELSTRLVKYVYDYTAAKGLMPTTEPPTEEATFRSY